MAGPDLNEIFLATRDDAVAVFDAMNDLMGQYGRVTVADLYELVDIRSQFLDRKIGWTDSYLEIKLLNLKDGWQIILPDPKPLD